jgi:hypothetical protein
MTGDSETYGKAERRADVELVVGYHREQLAELLERVREGFRQYDAGEIDAFELDDLIHRYKRSARELWKLCGELSGSRVRSAARGLRHLAKEDETVDWWDRGDPTRE